jgi:asparagine synthase (glutamine-hydrolysing)
MAVDVRSYEPPPEEFDQGPPLAWTASFAGSPPALRLVSSPEGATAELAADGATTVVFDGVLHDRGALVERLGGPADHATDADIALRAWRQQGPDCLRTLRGSFALAVHDGRTGELTLARDPLGTHPLFYARTDSGLFLSPSTNSLALEPAVSARVNRALVADTLCQRWPVPEETYYLDIKRVPSGHLVRLRDQSLESRRYWDPSPPGEPVRWADDDEVDGFDDLLDQAVDRCLSLGPAGIYLSGGLDSISVAAVATERTSRHGMSPPLALSLSFPEPQSNEEQIQRAVASKLGLPHVMSSIEDVAGPDGLLRAVLDLSSKRGAPIIGCWLPGYRRLGLEARNAGCATILSGAGGDEWLGISFYLAADLLRTFDVPGLVRFGRIARRSFTSTRISFLRNLLWRFGLRPLLREEWKRALWATAPDLASRRRRRRILEAIHPWVARDPALREQLVRRGEEAVSNLEWERSGSFYLQQGRMSLDHAVVSMELEELFENGRHLGLRMTQPYWDPDLVDLLYRVPPDVLTRGGRAKGLVRASEEGDRHALLHVRDAGAGSQDLGPDGRPARSRRARRGRREADRGGGAGVLLQRKRSRGEPNMEYLEPRSLGKTPYMRRGVSKWVKTAAAAGRLGSLRS